MKAAAEGHSEFKGFNLVLVHQCGERLLAQGRGGILGKPLGMSGKAHRKLPPLHPFRVL